VVALDTPCPFEVIADSRRQQFGEKREFRRHNGLEYYWVCLCEYRGENRDSEIFNKECLKNGLETFNDKSLPYIRKSETPWKMGKKEGLETVYHNGKKYEETPWKNGKREGKRIRWYESGRKKDIVLFKNNLKEGLETGWYEPDKKKYETHYKNGKQEGAYKEWYKSGKKKHLKHYKNGIENGKRKEWDEDGVLIFEGNFVNGVEEIK